jgi:hypothetical protein
MGSCFTENIGEKLDGYKFNTLQNPNGILFNPVSVADALNNYIELKQFSENDLFYYNEAWHSWKHHSRFSGRTAVETLEKLNSATADAHHYLKKANYIFITLGSSWVYVLTENAGLANVGAVAANNHKAPASWFYRRLLSSDEILQALENVIQRLFHFNQKLRIIFTISPVRHLREGVVENNRSKALLIQAVHSLVDKSDRLYYFPAYELVIDDLRDYRFYAEDLVHPNYFATQYVWEKLVAACMEENTQKLMEEIQSINLAYKHRAFNPASQQHLRFLQLYFEKTRQMQTSFPHLNFDRELSYFNRQ